MKNFARLVRFAWPYRFRFGLSLACALMVAALGIASISAVYPLLKILFYDSENCQKWVAQKIDTLRTEIRTGDVRVAELDAIAKLGNPADPAFQERLRAHFIIIDGERDARSKAVDVADRKSVV